MYIVAVGAARSCPTSTVYLLRTEVEVFGVDDNLKRTKHLSILDDILALVIGLVEGHGDTVTEGIDRVRADSPTWRPAATLAHRPRAVSSRPRTVSGRPSMLSVVADHPLSIS
jgi:hypothetical protein